MKKLALALTAASALAAAAVPAAAQPYGGYGPYDRYERPYDRYDGYDRYDHYDRYGRYGRFNPARRAAELMRRIDQAELYGTLSQGSAVWLRRQVAIVRQLAWRYRADGVVTLWERRDIDVRFDRLARRIDEDAPRYGYGRDDDDDDDYRR